MKAAVLNKLDSVPFYIDFPDPVPQDETQIVMNVKAAALKNLDKVKTKEFYYAHYSSLPVVVGTDGVGTLSDGTNVYAMGITGTLGQKSLISANRYTVLPANIDFALAAALPNAVLGSAIPLKDRAEMKQGDVVLINGATGITGKVAVQIAKYYGASKIIVTGRIQESLQALKTLGADVAISILQDDETFLQQIKEIDQTTPIDIVLDYIWGKPAELIMNAFQNRHGNKIRFVTMGDMAGRTFPISSGVLRSADILLMGSGFGSLTPEVMSLYINKILPEMFALAAAGKLTIETENMNLKDISTAWSVDSKGKRLVVIID